jgi:hypothetical protein
MKNRKTVFTLIPFALALFCAFAAPNVFGVVPAPDGGYPGGNTAEGTNALFKRTTGVNDTAVGLNALYADTTGGRNTGLGAQALRFNVAGFNNTAIGTNSLYHNTNDSNTAVGDSALFSNTTGMQNTAIGGSALNQNTGGSFNTALGYAAGYGVTTANNVICIGAYVAGTNTPGSCFIGNIYGKNQGFGALPVYVNGSNGLGTVSSSRRFKDDIKPMNKTSEVLFALKPVTFRYKKELDPAGISQFGLVAEDVEKLNADLVVRDKEGKPYSVRYDQVNAMLLNEFLKEHKKVEEQQATIAELRSAVAQQQKDFHAKLAEQQERIEALASCLQKVSAQIQLSKAAPQMAFTNQNQ